MRETYDVRCRTQQLCHETFTKISRSQSTSHDFSNCISCEKEQREAKNISSDEKRLPVHVKQMELLKYLITGYDHVFETISSQTSLQEYMEMIKSELLDNLGSQTFINIREYLHHDDVTKVAETCESLYDVLGKDKIHLLPLVLHYHQCEKILKK